jgi:hypothetical protein
MADNILRNEVVERIRLTTVPCVDETPDYGLVLLCGCAHGEVLPLFSVLDSRPSSIPESAIPHSALSRMSDLDASWSASGPAKYLTEDTPSRRGKVLRVSQPAPAARLLVNRRMRDPPASALMLSRPGRTACGCARYLVALGVIPVRQDDDPHATEPAGHVAGASCRCAFPQAGGCSSGDEPLMPPPSQCRCGSASRLAANFCASWGLSSHEQCGQLWVMNAAQVVGGDRRTLRAIRGQSRPSSAGMPHPAPCRAISVSRGVAPCPITSVACERQDRRAIGGVGQGDGAGCRAALTPQPCPTGGQ